VYVCVYVYKGNSERMNKVRERESVQERKRKRKSVNNYIIIIYVAVKANNSKLSSNDT